MAKTTLHMDYYPGGSIMPGRSFNSNSYRFGYNAGSEKDDEIFGTTGSAYHTYFRELDTRINRWWGIDPKANLTPWESPYASMGNNPIWYNDPLGDLRDNYKLLANGEITKTEDTKDNFDVLYNENESAGIQLDKGILKNKRTGNAEKGSYDIYQIRGDNQGLEFFKFVSMFSKVEWSLFPLSLASVRL